MTPTFLSQIKARTRFRSPSDLQSGIRWILACSLVVVAALMQAPQAHAVSSQGAADADVMLGAAFASHSYGTHFTWGLGAHYNLLPQVDVGLSYQHFSRDTTDLAAAGLKYTTSYNYITAEANYLFTGMLEGAYAGGKLGWSITSDDRPNTSDKNNLVFGPDVGYDFMLGNNISLGGQLNILWRTGTPFFGTTSLLALLKYNFI